MKIFIWDWSSVWNISNTCEERELILFWELSSEKLLSLLSVDWFYIKTNVLESLLMSPLSLCWDKLGSGDIGGRKIVELIFTEIHQSRTFSGWCLGVGWWSLVLIFDVGPGGPHCLSRNITALTVLHCSSQSRKVPPRVTSNRRPEEGLDWRENTSLLP